VPTQAVFYRDADGREPVREYLAAELGPNARQHIVKQIEAMNGLADDFPPLAFPQTSQIEGGLRELRCHSGSALYRIRTFKRPMDASERRGPRPAGKDAP
jgi:phage-related protein